MEKTASQQFVSGVRGVAPILIGVVPFGMIYGILALGVGLNNFDAQAMSAVIFAGSSQFMTVQLIGAGTPALIMILTGFVINLRHALYSATIAPYVRHLPFRWKALLSYLLTDEAFAVSVLHYQREGVTPKAHWYFFGAGLALWSSWQVSTAVGIFLVNQLSASDKTTDALSALNLDFALPLTFIALVVPALKDKAGVITAVIASVAAILFFGLPFKLGLIAASFVAIAAGLWMEARQ